MIYFDNAASTPVKQEVLDTMMVYMTNNYANPGSAHSLGRAAADAIKNSRRQVANKLHCDPEQIIFTSGGTEANNLALLGLEQYLRANNKNHIITTAIEHDSVLNPIDELERRGFEVTIVPVNKFGIVSPCDIEAEITDNTGLVSVMYVNNEIGSLNPVHTIGKVCRKHNVLFHTDAVQALPSIDNIDVDAIRCDLMSVSAQKIGGPKGIGALYVRDKTLLNPIIFGGKTQEFGIRGGTENVAGIVGFGKACEILAPGEVACSVPIFIVALTAELKELGCCGLLNYNGMREYSGTSIINIRFDGIDNETLMLMLETKGVYVSAGSACNGHSSEPSHVLKAIGLSDEEVRDSIRVSFSDMTVLNEISKGAQIIAECVEMLASMKDVGDIQR